MRRKRGSCSISCCTVNGNSYTFRCTCDTKPRALMRPATVRVILRRDKIRGDGTAPLYVRITQNRRSRLISTGLRVKPSEWNDRKDEVRASHELADAYNAK